LGGPKGGHCSQKLLLRRGSHSPPGRSRSSDQCEINNSSAQIRRPQTLLSLGLFSRPPVARLQPSAIPLAERSPSFPLQPVQSAGVQSPLRRIGGVVPVGPPKWLPPPPPLTGYTENCCPALSGRTSQPSQSFPGERIGARRSQIPSRTPVRQRFENEVRQSALGPAPKPYAWRKRRTIGSGGGMLGSSLCSAVSAGEVRRVNPNGYTTGHTTSAQHPSIRAHNRHGPAVE